MRERRSASASAFARPGLAAVVLLVVPGRSYLVAVVRLRVRFLSALFVIPLDLSLNVLAKVSSRVPARSPR